MTLPKPRRFWKLRIRFEKTELGCWLANLFPRRGRGSTTPWWRAFICRWTHGGNRSSSGMPSAGNLLRHDIRCFRCGAMYEIVRPNTPQYSTKMPFQKRDKTALRTWDEWWRQGNY